MKPLTAKKVMRILMKNGFVIARQRGSHIIFTNGQGIMVPVPLHGSSKPIHLGTFLAIVRQSKIPKEKFR